MDNVRYNISPCMAIEAKRFVEKIDGSLYAPRNTVMADDKSHYDRYSFLRGDSKVAVVYDTSAQVISITASQEYADELLRLFKPTDIQTIKRSTVPAQGSQRNVIKNQKPVYGGVDNGELRAKVFVTPRSVPNRYGATVIATAKGAEIYTDEIFPPQRVKRKTDANDDRGILYSRIADNYNGGREQRKVVEPALSSVLNGRQDIKKPDTISGLNISANGGNKGGARRPTISFGDEDDYKTKQYSAPPKPNNLSFVGMTEPAQAQPQPQQQAPKRRGRPPKAKPMETTADIYTPEYKTVTVKSFSQSKLTDLLNELKRMGARIAVESSGAGDMTYNVTNGNDKAVVKYSATEALMLQGRPSELFVKANAAINKFSKSNPVQSGAGGAKAETAAVDKALKHRLPTAYEFLSEQSRVDFSYGLHDFSKRNLQLSDYSVLLVPPFRGLERFVFELQRAEGIKVKMIGQAFDKDADGNYILKNGYMQRIGSVVYAEVMVALYTEYFSQRNFFAHSDNTADNVSRSITDRDAAKSIFDKLLAVVEYNAKKLKEIGFDITPKD